MFILDDLLVRPLVSIADVIHAVAIEELYDIETIRNDIKENRLLYELDERSHDEYERRKDELETQLDLAEQAHENLRGKVEVKR
jgi:hypothetical protein